LAPTVVAVAGSVLAGAVAIGHFWGDALITEVITLLLGIGYFALTRSDSDVGAIYGRRADERQRQVLLKASRLAFVVMISAAYSCAVIAVALGGTYWQADLIGSLGGVAYLLGMMVYGAHEDDPAGLERGVTASRFALGDESDTRDATSE
jgi:uncharacterized membrane protein